MLNADAVIARQKNRKQKNSKYRKTTMRIPWMAAALVVPPPTQHIVQTENNPGLTHLTASLGRSSIQDAASLWLAASPSAPSKDDIIVLRQAFAEFYGVERNLETSEQLLSDAISRWQGQPPDELAGLYRVRADCYMLQGNAVKAATDYEQAISLLQGPGGNKADPSELPAALLGRARAIKSQSGITLAQATQSANDYKLALKLSSREEWDTEQELVEDGAARNPYAAWEWGSMLRKAGKPKEASVAHSLASNAFDEVADKARSVMSLIDAGIDLAAADEVSEAESLLEKAVLKTKGVEGRDVRLLQRVIAKEGEGRMALAALLWNDGNRPKAEQVFGDACLRMEQLQDDAAQRSPSKKLEDNTITGTLAYSIDDSIRPLEYSCQRFKNDVFLSDQLGWPENLRQKVGKLQSLR
jgi:tetratricopeptide (TPR) repeat protein